jgi:hypothetical protein
MGKNQDPGSGINIPDPQHCLQFNPFTVVLYESTRIVGAAQREKSTLLTIKYYKQYLECHKCLSHRPNWWDPLTPSLANECASEPGGDTHSSACEGVPGGGVH